MSRWVARSIHLRLLPILSHAVDARSPVDLQDFSISISISISTPPKASIAMSPVVTKSSPTLVPPASPTPTSTLLLPLSSIYRAANARVSVEFIQVFSAAAAAAPSPPSERVAAIREGFARALVPYFPVAGRIIESVPGEPMVECSGDGIWFVEAEVDCALDDVNQHARSGRCSRLEALGRAAAIRRHPAEALPGESRDTR
ncbi:LOW QUALITY PROTEIN: acyl transferase 9-like [Ananas comosus]|uniref:LOW QUALITY PROTEIN: acyl transferase 9-like n=1 Tax=Ananas comosus TaxID=4615 RepID=A0A6P5EY45_ANACO|nr:LOW QUALITY PROTEIN: acyl transferase 9-like [Ananas comosus]